jgi:LysM domain-containing protein
MVENPPMSSEAGLRLTPAVLGALLVLALSFALSVGFVVANGGMELPGLPGGNPQAGVASASPSAATSELPATDPPATPSAAPSAEPSAEASVGSATAAPTAAPTPRPLPTATPRPSSDRYALLEPCGDEPDCWIYTVRGGDNLVSIARYFGVPLDVVTARNPWTETTSLVAGRELRLPPPTR